MRYREWRVAMLAVAVSGVLLTPAVAEEKPQGLQNDVMVNPPLLDQSSVAPKGTLLMAPATDAPPTHPGRERVLDLVLRYTQGQIYNPSQGRYDDVKLRSYTGTDVDTAHPFVAPTIEVTPGDTVRIRLNNQLPPDSDVTQVLPEQRCAAENLQMNVPHCFNGTNLHTHGLWVSPTGNSDNVLVSINPQVAFEYEYNIPADHPAGTYWYHPHRHGSTALQVGSGVAGALIIRGNRNPTQTTNGDLDTLVKPFPDRVVEFEQIPYACYKGLDLQYQRDANGKIIKDANGKDKIQWDCVSGGVGEVNSYAQFSPGTWAQSGRYTSVNGRIFPIVNDAKVGQTERWRLIHAGVRDTIKFEFHKVDAQKADAFKKKKASGQPLTDDDLKDIVAACSQQTTVPYALVAADGLTMSQEQTRSNVILQPGYRYDLLVNFPEAGEYCAVDAQVPQADSVTQTLSPTALLGFVHVDGPAGVAPIKDPIAKIKEQLTSNAQQTYPANVAKQVFDDLNDGFKLSKFTPHKPISDAEIAKSGLPTEKSVFFINTSVTPNLFEVGKSFNVVKSQYLSTKGQPMYVPEGARPYDPSVVDRPLVLGAAQEWELRSYFVSHPFHIHVNPFEIIEILDPSGRDVSTPDSGDPEYAGMKGMWKDTIWVKSNNNSALTADDTLPGKTPPGTYTIKFRTRYERYIGEFVLHCHILDHEDQGMMQNVSIGVPSGSGGTASAHAHGTH